MGRNKHALATGLFLIALIAMTIIVIFWIGHFEQKHNVYVIATHASVSGLTPESTVYYRGIAVGKVLKIEFDARDTDIIVIPVAVDAKIVLTKGVYATLRMKGVTGLTQIQLEDNNNLAEILPPGGSFESRIPLVPSVTDRLLNSGEEILKKADHIMQRLSAVLTDANERNINDILSNSKILSVQLQRLDTRLEEALAGVPSLNNDVHTTLMHINQLSSQSRHSLGQIDHLTSDLQQLTQQLQQISVPTILVAKQGAEASLLFTQTTLPHVNKLLIELQAATQQISRAASSLESNPQALLLGPSRRDVGPGELGFQEQP